MGTVLAASIAGWLILFSPPPDGTNAKLVAKKTHLSEDARIERAEELTREAGLLWEKGNLDTAAKKFEEAVALDPDAANAWNGLGWTRLNSGDPASAVVAFEKCVALESNHPGGLNGLGQGFLSLREYDKALKFLLKAAPKAPAAWYGLARVYMLTDKYDKAQPWIKKALAQQPNDEMLKEMLAAAKQGELPEDLRKKIEPVKVDSSEAETIAMQGWGQFNEGKVRSAERSFRRALAKDPENLTAMNGLGFLLLNMGKSAEAKTLFEKCLEIDPDAAGPMNGLARILKEQGKTDEAIALWEKMNKKFPGPTAASVGLAMTYLEKKEYAKALPFFEELVKAQPDNGEFKKGLEDARKGAALERLRVQGAEAAREAAKN